MARKKAKKKVMSKRKPPIKALRRLRKDIKMGKEEGKVADVMHEFKMGELRSGSKRGPIVRSPKQAIAIGLSEARRAVKKRRKK